VTALLLRPPGVAAAPAQPQHGFLCFVQDANLVQYTVPCDYHEVFKTDENGNRIALLMYEDQAQLPPGAALPTTTLHSIFHVACGCLFEGDYGQILTPSGVYHSYGPIHHP
jgi:hypothetical protein